MNLRAITRLLLLLLFCMSPLVADDGVAVVTGEHGYLLNKDGAVVDVVGYRTVFRVLSMSKDDHVTVEHFGQQLRLHKRQCHLSKDWGFVNEYNAPEVYQVLSDLHKAEEASAMENDELMLKYSEDAILHIGESKTSPDELRPWALQMRAYYHSLKGDLAAANSMLDECDEDIALLKLKDHPFTADVVNVRAIVRTEEGKWAEAVDLYQQATEIAARNQGKDHVDYGILQSNLSSALNDLGNTEKAILSQRACLKNYGAAYPPTAVEVALAQITLADLLNSNEQYEAANKEYQSALRQLVTYHPHLIYDIAKVREDLIYTNRMLSNFIQAEKECDDMVKSLQKYEPVEQYDYRKRLLLRRGLIDFDQGDFAAALAHYRYAVDMADETAYAIDDGYAFENAGDALAKLGRDKEALSVYEKAVSIYIELEGKDSENLVTARESMKALARKASNSLEKIVMVGPSDAYLLDDDSNIMTVIPKATVLRWLSAGDQYYEVEYEKQVGRVLNSQLQIKEQIPGYGDIDEKPFRAIVAGLTKYLKAMESGDLDASRQHLKNVRDVVKEIDPQLSGNTIDAWVEIQGLQLLTAEQGPAAALKKLSEINDQVAKLDSRYHMELHLKTAEGILQLRIPEQAKQGVASLKKALDLAEESFGKQHSVTAVAARRLGQAQFFVNDNDGAVESLRQGFNIAEAIFPAGSENLAIAATDVGMILFKSERYKEAVSVLDNLLSAKQSPPLKQTRLATIIRASSFARLEQTGPARIMLIQVLNELANDKDANGTSALDCAEGVMTLFELGRMEVGLKNWDQATQALTFAVEVSANIGVENTFDGSEIHRLLADAYEGQGQTSKARTELQKTLAIYEKLGGKDRPQAKTLLARIEKLSPSKPRESGPIDAVSFDRAQVLRDINEVILHLPIAVQMGFVEIDRQALDKALLERIDSKGNAAASETAAWAMNAHNLLPELIGRLRQVHALATVRSHIQDYTRWRQLRAKRAEESLSAISSGNTQRPKTLPTAAEDQAFSELPKSMQDEVSRQFVWRDIQDVRRKLQATETLVLVRRVGPRKGEDSEQQAQYLAWIIPPEGSERVRMVSLGYAQYIEGWIDKAMPRTFAITSAIEAKGEKQAALQHNTLLKIVADDVWKRIAIHLPDNTNRLALCLDGDLMRLPWAGLPTTTDGRTVLDDFTLRFLSSPRDLFVNHNTTGLSSPVMIAATDYLVSQDTAFSKMDPEELYQLVLHQVRVPDTIIDGDEYLPDTRDELDATEELFRKWNQRDRALRVNDNAVQLVFLQMERPQALHLSTKNYMKPARLLLPDEFRLDDAVKLLPEPARQPMDPLQQCAIRLGGRGGSTLADGLMTGHEIVSQDLRGTRLVVLSRAPKSQSATADRGAGDGLLPHIFQMAGARSVVTTIWGEDIEDSAMIAVTKAFYKHLASGKSKSDALRAAQLEARDARVEQNGAAHPFYWAGFRITGEG